MRNNKTPLCEWCNNFVIQKNHLSAKIELFRLLFNERKGVEIIEGHLVPDHIHMLVSIPPKYSISQFMGYLKGKSALMIYDKHANLKYKYGNRHFWAERYYMSTVGLNEATMENISKSRKNMI